MDDGGRKRSKKGIKMKKGREERKTENENAQEERDKNRGR